MTMQQRGQAAAPCFGPAILRVCAEPLSVVSMVRSTKVAALLDEWLSARSESSRLAPDLDGCLFRLLPLHYACEDARRAIMHVKRCVHRGLVRKKDLEAFSVVTALLPPKEADELSRWRCAVERMDEIGGSDALDVLSASNTRAALATVLHHQHFQDALSLFAPELYDQLSRQEQESIAAHDALSQRERTTLAYALRAACKTSPLGTFMFSIHCNFDGEPATATLDTDSAALQGRSFMNQTYALGLLRAMRESVVDERLLILNSRAVFLAEGHVRSVASIHRNTSLGTWRSDRSVGLSLGKDAATALQAVHWPATESEVLTHLRGTINTGAEQKLLEGFVRAGVINTRLWPRGRRQREAQASATRAMAALSSACREVSRVHGHERARLLNRIRDDARALSAASGAQDDKLELSDIVSEVGVANAAPAQLPILVRSLLAELLSATRKYVYRNPYHAALVQAFRQRFGTGRCRDIEAFLTDFAAERPPSRLRIAETQMQPPITTSANSLRTPITAYLQIAVGGAARPAMLVVNQLHSRGVWQAARVLKHMPASRASLAAMYRRWLLDCHAPAEPVELTVCADCTALQRPLALTPRRLAWGNEQYSGRRSLDLRNIELMLDYSSEQFTLIDRQANREVALVYLGGLVPFPAWGLPYYLASLCSPNVVLPPQLPQPAASKVTDRAVVSLPRVVEGSIVWQRATWIVDVDTMAPLMSGTTLQRTVALRDFFVSNSIPLRSFVRSRLRPGAAPPEAYSRKPMPMQVDDPAYHDALKRMLKRANELLFAEVLPEDHDQFCFVDGARHVSELQVDLLVQ